MLEEARERFRGVIPAVFTPFSSEGALLEGPLREHIDFLVGRGVHGLYVCGSAGLGPILSTRERKRVAEIAVEECGGRVPLIVNIGTPSTYEAVELARHAEGIGSDAIACITPYYYNRIDGRAIVEHYAIVAGSVDLPVFVYNLPSATGVNVTADMLAEMVERVPNIVGIKDSSGSIAQISSYVNRLGEKALVFNGSDATFLSALAVGARGAVSAIANVAPDLMLAVYGAFSDGRLDEARSAQLRVSSLRAILRGHAQWAAYYEAVRLFGRGFGTVKRPLRPLTEEEVGRLRDELVKGGFIEKTAP